MEEDVDRPSTLLRARSKKAVRDVVATGCLNGHEKLPAKMG
jgi:hypothetical protein